ncbi:MAG: lytic transglycosylase domain-containing protein, partial [Treponema sp.]|nr:lytic transglycosylase domain-containing protein [Treponema sp.]
MLDVSRRNALRSLKQGDVSFILRGDPAEMGQIARIHPAAPFYAGFLVDGQDPFRGTALFEAALECSDRRVREEAGKKLLSRLLEDKNLFLASRLLGLIGRRNPPFPFSGDPSLGPLWAAASYLLGYYDDAVRFLPPAEDAVSRALALAVEAGSLAPAGSGPEDPLRGEPSGQDPERAAKTAEFPEIFRGKAVRFFFTEAPDWSYLWVLGELRGRGYAFTETETAAIAGRLAVSKNAYDQSLENFEPLLKQSGDLFLEYPELLGDLGRTFQYGSYQEKGAEQFLEWNSKLEAGRADIRYLLLFFTGRIRRQMGRRYYARAAEHFAQALELAPDAEQADACIWYILHMTLTDRPEDLLPLLRTYAPRWNSELYFRDILDRYVRYLTANRKWEDLKAAFSLIRSGAAGTVNAKYAYILGRAAGEGYLQTETPPEEFFRAVLEEDNAPFYYRTLAAFRLEAALPPVPEDNPAPPRGEDLDFLLNFFEFGGAGFVKPYLEEAMDRLSTGELRQLSEAFAASPYPEESIRLTGRCMERQGYRLTRRDLELYYPRSFKSMIEDRAREAGIPVEIFFGLIHTESAFIPGAGSRAGAQGLAQLMPATARETAGRIARQGGPDYLENGEPDLYDPKINVHLGAAYLGYLMEHMESPLQALLAYNGGMGRVRSWRSAEPKLPEDLFLETIGIQETREYGKK